MQSQKSRPITSQSKTSPYYDIASYTLCYIEPKLQSILAAHLIAQQFFPHFHYISGHQSKTLRYYTAILSHTQSINVETIFDKNIKNKILFHKMFLKRVITLSQWNNPPYEYRNVTTPFEFKYNYYNYIDGWSNVFLHQNEQFSYSWFIYWDSRFSRNVPNWFYQWWEDHTSQKEHFPQLQNLLRTFAQKTTLTKWEQNFRIEFIFMSKFKIPWIFKWSYGKEDGLLFRSHSVKWWDKFAIDRV